MIAKRKLDSRFLIARFMNRNIEILDDMDAPEYDGFFMDSDKTVCLVNELMRQICDDQAKNNMRSALRKTVLLNGILKKIISTGDE